MPSCRLTWKEFFFRLFRLNSGADKGNPLVLGCAGVGVGAAEDIDIRSSVHLHFMEMLRVQSLLWQS